MRWELILDYLWALNAITEEQGWGAQTHTEEQPHGDGAARWEDAWLDGATSQGCRQPLGSGRALRGTSRGQPTLSASDTDLEIFGLQNCENIKIRCFKPPGSWMLVITASGNQCPGLGRSDLACGHTVGKW